MRHRNPAVFFVWRGGAKPWPAARLHGCLGGHSGGDRGITAGVSGGVEPSGIFAEAGGSGGGWMRNQG